VKPWIPILALGLALSPLAVVHPIRIRGRSMEPTLRNGQVCWALRSWAAGRPTRHQIWLVDAPDGPSLKRVLALPGEHLEIHEGDLLHLGKRLEEPYVQYSERSSSGPWEAGSGYLVLGDNRPESRDSRTWGPLPRRSFRGRVLGME
jgi:signal peptidase I